MENIAVRRQVSRTHGTELTAQTGEYFHFDFLKHLGGVELRKEELAHFDAQNKPTALKLHVTGKIKHVKNIEVDNFLFLQEQIKGQKDAIVKMTIPSPSASSYCLLVFPS